MYKIKNEVGKDCEIILYDLIEDGYTARYLLQTLKDTGGAKRITLHINSEGGDVMEAIAVYNYLKSLDADITVRIDGLAASAATVIACAGHVVMPSNSMMMIHNVYGAAYGDADEVRAMAEVIEKMKTNVMNIYRAKTGQDEPVIRALMSKESWLTAEEAYNLGFCDEIVAEVPKEPDDNAAVLTAVQAERTRLQELDGLMTPERKGLINSAKYKTFKSAGDIALELLKLQARSEDNAGLQGISAGMVKGEKAAESVSRIINRRRGYKNGR